MAIGAVIGAGSAAVVVIPVVFLVTAGLTWVVREYALRAGMVDHPGPRRSHDRLVPRGGGLAIVLAMLAALGEVPAGPGLWRDGFLFGSVLIAGLGWMEDHRPLPVAWRLAIQLLLAGFVVTWLGPVEAIGIAGRLVPLVWLWTPMAILALVWMMNLFNFMDGSDGLAASQAIFSGLLLAMIFFHFEQPGLAWLAALGASASAGFLVWNWPRASIFLGDVGSLFLGWWLGFLALAGTLTGTVSVWLAFIVVSPFVVDATCTLVWRVAGRAQWYTAHRDHAYQRLIRSGWRHGRVLRALLALNVSMVLPAAALAAWQPWADVIIAVAVGGAQFGIWYRIRSDGAKELVNE